MFLSTGDEWVDVARAQDASDEPAEGGRVREFTIHAIEVDIVYNRFGLHQPNGAMYVLEENLQDVQRVSGKVPGDAFQDLPEDARRREDERREGEHETEEEEREEQEGGEEEHEDEDEDEKGRGRGRGRGRGKGRSRGRGRGGGEAKGIDTSVIQPLVIRANKGDVVEITFVNHLDRHASIHQTALPYDVNESDGMAVGFNPDTTAPPGETVEYRWFASHEGAHFFMDGANQAYDSADEPPQEANLLARGLFGTMVVEPEGATWTDPETGGELRSGVRADVHDPTLTETSYREFVVHYHSPQGVETADGDELTFPGTDVPQHPHAINYRADPTAQRVNDECPDCDLEEYFYNSWTNGDPGGGDNVYEAYSGDPTKFIAVGASIEENHVHHLHNHRWTQAPRFDDRDDTRDAQTIGLGATIETPLVAGHGEESVRPGMDFSEAFEVGAGYVHGGAGDILFHCHLFPHYGEGMWGIFRINDKEQSDLKPLPSNEPPIPADSDTPGFPDFIPGEQGEAPPLPPYPDVRSPTPEEEAALGDEIIPGAPYAEPCQSPEAKREIEYTIVAVDANIVYNDAGDHDPNGQVFVLEADADAVREGRMNPEPLVIRANTGDCIKITLKNELDSGISNHPHFVGYDVLGSDSLSTGYNYKQWPEPGEDLNFRLYADEEGTIFFHDHVVGIDRVMNGTFAQLIIEPEGSEWLDPHTGEPIQSGTQAIIENPQGNDFREFCLQYQDFAQLVDRDGTFVNGNFEHNQNHGVMAINYRNTPYYHRDDADAAYVHSSAVHGDPPTPTFESYTGDPIRVRLTQTAYEEQHNFGINGLRPNPEGLEPPDTVSQIIGTAESFTYRVRENVDFEPMDNPLGLPVRDYLYGSMVMDDLWNGMWGVHRVFGARVPHLHPLPDRGSPSRTITEDELREMGHPAAFDDWWKEGRKARMLYDEGQSREFPADAPARRNESVGEVPPKAPNPGDPCPDDAPVRQYNVTALQTSIVFDRYGDHDPHGIVFVLDEHVEDVLQGERPTEPLTIRANQGECVEITLTNALPENFDNDHAHPQTIVQQEWEASNRISLHTQRIQYDVNGSDGATVGFNFDQTVGPGESITYRFYAQARVGPAIMWDMADIRSHRHHGAFGHLIIEPEDCEYLDPRTGEPLPSGSFAMIKNPNGEDFREFTLSLSDGRHIVNPDGSCVVPPGPDVEEEAEHEVRAERESRRRGDEVEPEDDDGEGADAPCNQIPDDPEDQGYLAVNNRAEPFARRFENNDAQHLVYSSEVHGDPSTPVLNALLGERVRFRITHTADKARGLSFHLAAHQWAEFPGIPDAGMVGVWDKFMPGKSRDIEPAGGAGGLAESAGDFIYQGDLKMVRRLEAGIWGIFRVRASLDGFEEPTQPLPDTAAERAIAPDEHPGWEVERGDVTGDGTKDVLVGVPRSDIAGSEAGAAYLFVGPIRERAITDLADADVRFLGPAAESRTGIGVDIEEGSDGEAPHLVVEAGDHTAFEVRWSDSLLEEGTVVLSEEHPNVTVGRAEEGETEREDEAGEGEEGETGEAETEEAETEEAETTDEDE